MVINGRTDLVSEVRRRLCDGSSVTELPGVRALEESVRGFPVTTVEILDERGEAALGRPRGTYITMELPRRITDCFGAAARTLSLLIKRCAGELPECILLAGLGNPDITPDAVGALTAERFIVTAHLKQKDPEIFSAFRSTLLCRPGVLGTSGIESARQIGAICRETKPGLVIAVDALAGAELQTLCRSVQICNTGIAPGSGVGNAREALNRDTLGIPVLAVGVPTVLDASALRNDPELHGMFVTPRAIDSMVRSCARLLGAGLNLALHEGLRLEEMGQLLDE